MRKFRVMLMALAATAVIAAGQVGVAQAVLICADGGNEAGSLATLAGTYTFTFLGNNITGASPLAGSGSVTLNGNGKVTGGIIRCNQAGQFTTPITGGCYTINSDGTGFIAITTSELVCGSGYEGVDLDIAVSQPYGVQFQFSSNADSLAGFFDVFSGTANRP
jgi:hypothetical protein